MVRFLFLLLGVLVIGVAPTTGNCDEKPTPSGEGEPKYQEIVFGDMLIEGNFRSPEASYFDPRKRAEFPRALRLRTSYLPTVRSASTSPSFRLRDSR